MTWSRRRFLNTSLASSTLVALGGSTVPTFLSRSALAIPVEEVLVTGITQRDGGFELNLGNGERALARKVIVAIGVEHFAHVPEALSKLPTTLCTHSSAHSDLAAFRGQEVIVVGAGQSALESAALLHENGAAVQLLVRKRAVVWNGDPLPRDRSLLQRLRVPEAGLGAGRRLWFYSNYPDLFRQLPRDIRVDKARTVLGPAGAFWLRSRVEGQLSTLAGHTVASAEPQDERVRLKVAGPDGVNREVEADHVIAATGYRVDLTRLEFLSDSIRPRLRTVAGSPAVDHDYQSSVPGLYFIGTAVAPTFGPVMRFVFGTCHAAPSVARGLGRTSSRRPRTAVTVDR